MAIVSLSETLKNARVALLAERNSRGHWEGELSTSALSTATASVALGSVDEKLYHREVKRAVDWLVENQNEDGGWGDTTKSFSNISTTLLCWSAVTRFGGTDEKAKSLNDASNWIRDYAGSLSPALITETVKARYGRDRTFSVPILMLCAICGTLGEHGWKWVMPMPFQLAAFPRKWFAVMRLPVVSYALPALIAIGHARWKQGASGTRFRNREHPLWARLSRLLEEIQPASGGFLEAAPLTSFVTMALVSAGEKDHPVAKQGVEFLLATVREDGSWPIDTNLATWATTLAVKSLKSGSPATVPQGQFDSERAVLDWLMGQQYREVHPFTNTPPGGWAWTQGASGTRFRNREHPLWARLSRLLEEIQPASGGFLEAAPLTSFVTMALVSAGEKDHPVAKQGVEFLLATVREDGSWPIDTNLATWATTLAVKSLKSGSPATVPQGQFDSERAVLDWLMGQQYREVHPFTNTPPGGWAWTDLTGGVPDADDTPGALIALDLMESEGCEDAILTAAESGLDWLLNLQNDDGGIPTFCKGWGALPFDRSSPDITAHTLRAWHRWRSRMPKVLQHRIDGGIQQGLHYLARVQHGDGSWMPLWFGNQHRDADEGNPTYGTAMVTRALIEIGESGLAAGGVTWLCENQNSDGGWGSLRDRTPSTLEETSLALTALSIQGELVPAAALEHLIRRGAGWLVSETDGGTQFDSSPIGFYFAKLWYFEKLYPLVWTVEALSHVSGLIPATCAEED